MHTKFIDKNIKYTGPELSPHWIYKNFNLQGDAIVSFIGECDVKIDNMVDIEDVINDSPIYSKQMLHFIIEHFNTPLTEGILKQRLLISIAKDIITKKINNPVGLSRKGDDLFYNEGKLSVSIAAKSINSVLIHFAMNIDSEGTPVKAAGLKTDMELNNYQNLAIEIMDNYKKECEEVLQASCKVRGIF